MGYDWLSFGPLWPLCLCYFLGRCKTTYHRPALCNKRVAECFKQVRYEKKHGVFRKRRLSVSASHLSRAEDVACVPVNPF